MAAIRTESLDLASKFISAYFYILNVCVLDAGRPDCFCDAV